MDKIEIKGLEVFAYHGVEEHEKENGQSFFIDADLYVDVRTPGMSDALDDTVNYASVCAFLDKYLRENRFDLIEAAAEHAALELLKKSPKIKKIDFRINKPSAPIGLPFENVAVHIVRKWHTVYLSIGSNIGDKEQYLNQAIDSIYDDDNCRVIQVSRFIETEPYGPVKQDNFLNGCVAIETLYSPRELLLFINQIEAEAGRVRDVHWGPRTLDIDIILYDQEIIYESDLMIPHKEMHKRAFVLEPLSQIAPYAMHPVLNKSISTLLEELSKEDTEQSGESKCAGCSGCAYRN